MDIGVVKTLENNRVLVSEKKPNKKGQIEERLYIVPEEKADKFIKLRKSSDSSIKTQKNMSTAISVVTGLTVGAGLKLSKLASVAAGVAATGVTYFACNKFDRMADDTMRNTNIKTSKAQEVTGQDINKIV